MMKRSLVNSLIKRSSNNFQKQGIKLPAFAHATPEALRAASLRSSNIVQGRLGWDVTDYGKGKFDDLGLTLFTLRNVPGDNRFGGYCEKLMFCQKDQACQLHRHAAKSGDLINRAGGDLILNLFNSDSDGKLDNLSLVSVISDGKLVSLNAGEEFRLLPGESVSLPQGIWHRFCASNGDVVVGEVSSHNDDLIDNFFTEEVDRFLSIDEDVPPVQLLVSDYVRWL
jgi:D-lyxose ketol-isomerase